jgi:hypothetical protein
VNASYIGLVDVRVHLHLRQVLRNQEYRGRLEGGCYRLAYIHVARHDDAVNGSRDLCMGEVDACLVQGRLIQLDLRSNHLKLSLGCPVRGFARLYAVGGGVMLGFGGFDFGCGLVVSGLSSVQILLRDD